MNKLHQWARAESELLSLFLIITEIYFSDILLI